MQRGDRRFVILFAVILVIGGIAVAFGLSQARSDAAAQGRRMAASASAVRNLMTLHYAMARYRIEGLSDADADGIGEHAGLDAVVAAELLEAEDWLAVDGSLQREGYRYRGVLPTATDDAELRFAVVALPAQGDWPLLAVDESGDLHVAPAGFTPDPAAPVDPHSWPRWR